MSFATSAFAFLLMVVAWLMHSHHEQTKKQVQRRDDWDEKKKKYLRDQVDRRKKVTYTIVVIAVAILFSPFVLHPVAFVIYWMLVLLMVGWMVLLAGIDIFATKSYLLSLRDQQIASRRALEEEVRRLREDHRKAHSSSED